MSCQVLGLGVGVKVGSGVAVKRCSGVGVSVGGTVGVMGVLVIVGGGVVGAGVVACLVGVGGVADVRVEVGTAVLVFTGVTAVLLAPGSGVTVGSGVTEAVGDGDGVLEGVSVAVGVAVWALAVSVAAITVCTMGGSVCVGAGVGVGQATSVGARSQYIITRATLGVFSVTPSATPNRPVGRRSWRLWLLRSRQTPVKQSSSRTAVSPS